jgi:hypothetical protein
MNFPKVGMPEITAHTFILFNNRFGSFSSDMLIFCVKAENT